jgi:putative N6-adenine-specific DNA methylase
MRANLWLRTASRILVRVAEFQATAFFELEKRARRIPWADFLASGSRPEFRVTTHKSRLYHSDAVAERLTSAALRAHKRQPRDDAPEQLFVVRVDHDVVSISADSSGELLHVRGYRQAVAKAPLRETLAAALLLAADWHGDSPLLDPFCGSGTIPIEGALIARRMAPGIQRDFAFGRWPAFDASQWQSLRAEAKSSALGSAPHELAGSDRDAGAIAGARANAQRAGVDVAFETGAISALAARPGSGLVATNPPYGVRVGDPKTLRDLYARFGDVLRQRFAGWRVAMYVSDVRLAKQTGLDLRELYRTTNGGLKVAAMAADVSA